MMILLMNVIYDVTNNEMLGTVLKLVVWIMYYVIKRMNFLLAYNKNLMASAPYRVISYILRHFSFTAFHIKM